MIQVDNDESVEEESQLTSKAKRRLRRKKQRLAEEESQPQQRTIWEKCLPIFYFCLPLLSVLSLSFIVFFIFYLIADRYVCGDGSPLWVYGIGRYHPHTILHLYTQYTPQKLSISFSLA